MTSKIVAITIHTNTRQPAQSEFIGRLNPTGKIAIIQDSEKFELAEGDQSNASLVSSGKRFIVVNLEGFAPLKSA